MSENTEVGEKIPYRATIETGGKLYIIENGPSEKKFLFNSRIFNDRFLKVNFTVKGLGVVSSIVTGFNKSFITEPLPLDQYMFFGRTDGGILMIGLYCLTQNRSGWVRFYTREELQKTDPILAMILG